MSIFDDIDEIDPEFLEFLIEKEKKENEIQYERPFLQLPVPELVPILPPKEEESEENEGVIIIDMC